ncbi:hypothetical protein Tco_0391234 [Tanacetum coccineum]
MSFSKHSDNALVCYTKPLDSLKNWNNHFFCVDDFACPTSFSWHTAKHVTRDPDPVVADFSAQDYATLVAHPSPFRKFPEAFMCLVGLSRHYTLDEETYPRFLHKNGEGGCLLIFDKGGSGNQTEQGDSAGGGEGVDIQLVSEPANTVVEDVAPLQPRRQRKRKIMVVDTGESFHPPKRLRKDHRTPSRTSVGGKSMFAVQQLLAGAVLKVEVRVEAIPTLPFVTAFVSTTPEHEVGDYTDSMVVPNLHTIRAPQRFVIFLDSSHHSSANVAEAEVDSLVRSSAPIMMTVTTVTSMVDSALVAKEKPIKPFLFSADSSLAGGANPNTGVFWILPIATFFMTNGSRLDDGHVCREMVDEFAPPKFFAFVHGMEHDQLFTEFNVGATRQISLSAEVRMRTEYNVKERRRLKSVVEKQDELLKAKDGEIEDLRAQLLLKEIEAVEATRLCAQSSNLEAIEKSLQDEVSALKGITASLKRSGMLWM